MEEKVIDIEELAQDTHNFNKGNEQGQELMERSFKEMGAGRSILIDRNGHIIAGNKSQKAAIAAGIKKVRVIETTGDELVAVKRTDVDIDSAEGRKMAYLDNLTTQVNLTWDETELEAVQADVEGFDIADFGFDIEDLPQVTFPTGEKQGEGSQLGTMGDYTEGHTPQSLFDKFVIPPFSILDTRQGYWKERKKKWIDMIGRGGESREGTLSTGFYKMLHSDGVSLFDPVLSEIIARWFTPTEHSNIIDPFAGDTMKGLVYSIMGHNFTGIELREEQVAINNDAISGREGIKYICDDGRNVLNHVAEQSQDLLMSCPPYFNLEVYSDLPNDASNQDSYADFIHILREAYSSAIRTLKPNRFAVIVVGDVRDKEGYYVDFISDVKRIFIDNGMKLYNELILVENIGTGAMVADRYMKSRKMKKTHQNVLVFYNGNTKEIANVFPAIEVQKEEATQ